MKVIIVYKEQSDHAREVRSYIRDYQRFSGKEIETIDPDSPRGQSFCATYGIMQYPTVMVLNDSGVMQQMWAGKYLPMIDDVSYYNR